MVHALELLHTALVPEGLLVDLRPARRALPGRPDAGLPHVYCQEGERRRHAGPLQPLKPLAQYRAAELAVRKVIRDGLFVLQATEMFPFLFHIASCQRFDEILATHWTDTAAPTSTRRRLGTLMRTSRGAEITIVEHVRLNVMRKQTADGATAGTHVAFQ
ncbi:MAG TPA: hypothetical protein VJT32_01350 [bacterium]|nr:hypothetical protein [bacterium]